MKSRLNKEKNNKKIPNIYLIMILLCIFLLIIAGVASLFSKESPEKILNRVLYSEKSQSGGIQYFLHNNHIYFSEISYDSDDEYGENALIQNVETYVMNEDGTNVSSFTNFENVNYIEDCFIYKNELYYHDPSKELGNNSSANTKINLDTGKITTLNDTSSYLVKTLKDGKIYELSKTNQGQGYDYTLYLNNLDTSKKDKIAETNKIDTESSIFIDYIHNDIYYINSNDNSYLTLYKNKDIYMELNTKSKDYNILAIDDKYIYYEIENIIYKVDISTKQIVQQNESNNKVNDLERIDVGNNTDNLFYKRNIYSFNTSKNNFEVIIEDIPTDTKYTYSINNKLVFSQDCHNFNNIASGFGYVIIYDKDTKEIKRYYNILKFNIDENNNMKLIEYDNNKLNFKQIQL